MINECNRLPDEVIHYETVNSFKHNLDHYLQFSTRFLISSLAFLSPKRALLSNNSSRYSFNTDPYRAESLQLLSKFDALVKFKYDYICSAVYNFDNKNLLHVSGKTESAGCA